MAELTLAIAVLALLVACSREARIKQLERQLGEAVEFGNRLSLQLQQHIAIQRAVNDALARASAGRETGEVLWADKDGHVRRGCE